VNQRSCAAVAVDGYTSANLAGFARNGVIVDDEQHIEMHLLIVKALKEMAAEIEQLEARVRLLEQ